MQKISDKIGENQFGKTSVSCIDCGKEFDMCFERTGPDSIEIKNGAIGKRDGEYLFKCQECWETDKSFGLACAVYSRVVGFLRPISDWNPGKQSEYKMRKVFNIDDGKKAVS